MFRASRVSVTLVEQTEQSRIRATVGLDAVKTTYNHVRHRLARPIEESGRALSEIEAEALARQHVRDTFFSGGTFQIQPAGVDDLRKVALWLGHADVKTTEVYLRIDPTEKLEAVEAVLPPALRRGRLRAPDTLIASLLDPG